MYFDIYIYVAVCIFCALRFVVIICFCLLFSSSRLMFYNILFMIVFLFFMSCFLFCALFVFALFLYISHFFVAFSLLSLYKSTDRCHRKETRLYSINNISYHILSKDFPSRLADTCYFSINFNRLNFRAVSAALYDFSYQELTDCSLSFIYIVFFSVPPQDLEFPLTSRVCEMVFEKEDLKIITQTIEK